MKVLQSLRGRVKKNSKGTTVRPLLVSVTQGKTKTYILTIKIGDLSYECVQHSNCNKWRTFRCKNSRKANAAGDKCCFKMKVKNISGVSPKENSLVFWRTKSWQVLENETADHHCCTGTVIETVNASGMDIQNGIGKSTIAQLPDVSLLRVLSFLSMKELFQLRAVSLTISHLIQIKNSFLRFRINLNRWSSGSYNPLRTGG